MSKQYTHYQEYFKSFLGGWSFENGDETLTIRETKEEQMYDAQTGGKKSGLCLYFVEKELPMVLNVTNADTIASVVGSDRLEDWIGKKIIVGQSNIKAFGKVQTVIRVRNEKPKDDIKYIKATNEQIEEINKLVERGYINLNAMLKHYKVISINDLSQDDAAIIIDAKRKEAQRDEE